MTEEPMVQRTIKDRTVGLILFGLFEILGGLICLLIVALLLVGTAMIASRPDSLPSLSTPGALQRSIAATSLQYLIVASLLTTLGVGSMLGRRWARTLSELLGWIAMVGGSLVATLVIVTLPQTKKMITATGTVTSEWADILLLASACIPLLVITAPGLGFVLFYGSADVRATCQYKDPKPRWTDRHPLPILALALMLACGVLTPLMLPMTHGALLMFGLVLKGVGALLVALLIAVTYGWCTWRVWQLDMRGWWTGLILTLGFGVGTLLSLQSGTQQELYGAMDMDLSPEQIEMIADFGTPMSTTGPVMVISLVVYLAFFLYTKRFFPGSAGERIAGPE